MPKHVGVDTCKLCFIVCNLLYFIKCICCLIYWRWQKLSFYANKVTEISLCTDECQKVSWYTKKVTKHLYFYTSKGTENLAFYKNKVIGAVSSPQQGYRLSLYTNKMTWVARSEVLTEVLSLQWINYPSIWIMWLRGYTFIPGPWDQEVTEWMHFIDIL